MNKLSLLCLALAASLGMAAQQINPITKAMLDGYEEILKENPNDYQTLYERAAQLYRLSLYDKAMTDLDKALQCTPAKEKVYRVQELSLMADILIEKKEYDSALKTVNEALELSPDNYANIYKKGNICLLLNKPEEAYRAFSSMQRLKTRSQEAYFGMAQACIMMGRTSEAEDLLKEAENADSSSYLTYCRVGDLYQEMGQNENAASNYLIGFSMSTDNSRPLNSLVELGKKDYKAVAAALNYAIDRSTNRVPLLFLKGSIAQVAGYYNDAEDAFTQLAALPQGNDASVYTALAETQFALNSLEKASANIDKAISLSPSTEEYILKSYILIGRDMPASAVTEASKAVASDTDNTNALIAKAYALTADKKGDEALATLNELVMIAPDNIPALLLRAYVNNILLNNGKSAVSDFNRIIAENPESFKDKVAKSIAMAKVGKKLDADAYMTETMATATTPEDTYYAAVYYAQTDNLEKGAELLKKAIYDGYGNKYNIEKDNTPLFNVSPLRHLMK